VLMHNDPLIGDEPGYDAVARSLIAGKGYWYLDYWFSSKSPGYSTFLAGTYRLFGRSPSPARAVQILLHVTMIALAIILAYRMPRSRTVGWITGLLAAVVMRVPMRRLAVGYAIAGMVAFVVLLPWSIRNFNVFGAFTPLPAYGGQIFPCEECNQQSEGWASAYLELQQGRRKRVQRV